MNVRIPELRNRRRSRKRVAAMYDTNAAGEVAPHIDYVSSGQVRRLFADFVYLQIDRRNFDGLFSSRVSACWARSTASLASIYTSGFEGEAMGGYLSRRELKSLKASWARAIADVRLAPEHRAFLRELTFDLDGFPQHRGRHAGIGGTFRLQRP